MNGVLEYADKDILSGANEWAALIHSEWSKGVESILATGRHIINAKAALPHGEFTAMVERNLPFGARTAQRLMEIANDARLTNAAHTSALPPSWMTLYELTKLSDEQFDECLTEGVIRPDMQRAEVRKISNKEKNAEAAGVVSIARDRATSLDDLVSRGLKFGTIYADPPWRYGNQATRASTGNHYESMSIDEIAALPVAELATENAHLHLWTTNAFLFDCQRIMESWGFEYRSCFVWVKPQMGIGNYWRVSHEFLLFGKRGSATFQDRSLKSWGEFDRGVHSAKPEQIRHMIERAGQGPRLEMFARRTAPGWTVWGNQVVTDLFDGGAA